MNIVIIEDEQPAVEKLITLLADYDRSIEIRAVLHSIQQAVEWLRSNPLPDLILLDIHLSDGLSFEIFQQVPVKCPVIFCTAHDEYALQAFQLHSIDYLLKPVQASRLYRSLEKMKEMRQPVSNIQMDDIINFIKNKDSVFKSRFMVKIGTKIKAIKTDEIAYFYSQNKLTLLVTRAGQNFPVDYALDELIGLLDPVYFFHINRKLIIHIDAAKEIHPYFKGRLKLILQPALEEEIIISSQKTPLFKTWLDH